MQNDDWAFVRSVESYLQGDFSVNPIVLFNKSAPVFYLQGIIGALFSMIFSIESLPILTAFISVGNFLMIYLILRKFFRKDPVESTLFGLLIIFNPIYFYSILGFMTENYFMFFLLLSFYLILSFSESEKPKDFILANLSIVLGFFIRQFSFVTSVSFSLYLFFRKKYKYAVYQGVISLIIYGVYSLVLSGLSGLYDVGLNFSKLLRLEYEVSLITAIFIYLIIFLFPVFMFILKYKDLKLSLLLFGIFFFILYTIFSPEKLYSAEFPYLGNTLGKTGFLTEDFRGIKGNFYGMFDFYRFLEIGAKVFVFLIPLSIIKVLRKEPNFFLIFFGVFLGLMMVSINVYDRYLTVVSISMLFILVGILDKLTVTKKVFLGLFIFVLSFLCYQFGFDFVYSRSAVWNMAKGIDNPKNVVAGVAWIKYYESESPKHFFSYNKSHKNYVLLETIEVNYPLDFFVNNNVYYFRYIP